MKHSAFTYPVLGLAITSLLLPGSSNSGGTVSRGLEVATQDCSRGLYIRHCAPCHGDFGEGDGPGAETLDPRPRDFSTGRFRLISTETGLPTREDLIEVITHGIVGSAMPPHDHLTLAQRETLADFVLDLTQARRAEVLQEMAEDQGEVLSTEDAMEIAASEAGLPVQLPSFIEETEMLLTEGRNLYMENCASCHDADGRGRTRRDLVDEQGQPIFARDFTAGILKGGSRPLDLYRRIHCGMPGSPMPGFPCSERESWALVYYVQSLIEPGSQERAQQLHRNYQPELVDSPLSPDPGAEVWSGVSSHWVAMAPLQWTETRVEGVTVQMARDDDRLGMRLVWRDATPGEGKGNITPDTATVRFSPHAQPQFFCPGREAETHEYWEWRGDEGDFTFEPLGFEVRSRHVDGHYELVFLRGLTEAGERVGAGSQAVSIAFEIRNGVAGDPDRSQNLTVWHRLSF